MAVEILVSNYRRLVMQLIFALLGLRNGLFVMFHTVHPGAGEDDLEEQLECASHLYLTGTFGIASLAGPYYLEFLAWRALKFRMHKNYMFYYIIELLLVDILFGKWLREGDNASNSQTS